MPFDKLRDRSGGSGTAVGVTVAEPAVAEPVEVSKQGSDPAVLPFLDEPSDQRSITTSSGTAVGGAVCPSTGSGTAVGGLGTGEGSVGGSVIWMFKMVEFLAGFVFYFYLCGDLS